MKARRGALPSWIAVAASLVAIALALLFGPGGALADAGAPAASASAPAKTKGGLTPMPDDKAVPVDWMPPGSGITPVPSDEIYPPQTITIRFNHKKHVQDLKQTCVSCHASAYKSSSAKDRLLPAAATCDGCHDVSHKDLAAVKPGKNADGQCTFCHLGDKAGEGGKVAKTIIPDPNLIFPHDKHLARNIQCRQCHGKVNEVELATREHLPRMAGCFTCHNLPESARGEANGECSTCHLTQPNGRLTTNFAGGTLLPPAWLRMADHSPDWVDRHKTVASNDSQFCASCHTDSDCADCHDGKVRNRKIHPGDFLSMHPVNARQDSPRCTSCHQLTTFCGDCHRRVGVARDVASGNQLVGKRFHPDPKFWTTAPRSSEHHAWEAQRNLNACVSCHTERDCASCHATKGVAGGQGVNPHPPGFDKGCRTAFSRNPRPCLVCHQSGDSALAKCK